jgi:hypothetical protein
VSVAAGLLLRLEAESPAVPRDAPALAEEER